MDQQSLVSNLKPAPIWSMEVGQLGAGLVAVAAILFLSAAVGGFAKRRPPFARYTFAAGCVAILGAMGCLIVLFLTDQFQFEYVANHSLRDLAVQYKVAAVWSGQQGSFLLWATTSAVFGLLAFWRAGPYQRWFIFAYSLFLGSLCGILAYETPFAILRDVGSGATHVSLLVNGVLHVVPNGLGLTPSLQNYWVIIHPPTIFTGFGSLTVPFAFAVSAMLTGNARDWLARVRPWALISISILGLGLVMGGLWAYETQGWGGFWAWDPVENVSFVPWIFCVAFVHGLIVQATRKRWHGTNLLMGGLPFLLFVYGTFLTRSGFLSKFSVHSFAEMNRSALWILMIFLIAVTFGFVALWIVRGRALGKTLDAPEIGQGFNREKAYQSGVILLTGLATTIAIGMSFPFFCGIFGGDGKVVDEPLYHSVVVWFFVPIMLLIGSAPFLSWRSMSLNEFVTRVLNVVGLTVGIVGLAMLTLKLTDWGSHGFNVGYLTFPFGIHFPRFSWVFCLFGLTAFAVVANVWRLVELFPRSKLGIGSFLAHIGVATALSGLVISRGLEQKTTLLVSKGSPATGLGYTVAFKNLTSNPEIDRDNKAEFEVTAPGMASFLARPGFFFIPGDDGQEKAFTWPHIQHQFLHDVYFSLGAPTSDVWEQPAQLKAGETKQDDEFSLTYLGLTMKGQPGKQGTTFGAKVQVMERGQVYPVVEPKIVVGGDAVPVRASPSFSVAFVGMNAADKSALIELLYVTPVYPIDLFYKPMTMLVWAGTGIMFLGGMLSAFYRRNRRGDPSPESGYAENQTTLVVEKEEDAPVPVS